MSFLFDVIGSIGKDFLSQQWALGNVAVVVISAVVEAVREHVGKKTRSPDERRLRLQKFIASASIAWIIGMAIERYDPTNAMVTALALTGLWMLGLAIREYWKLRQNRGDVPRQAAPAAAPLPDASGLPVRSAFSKPRRSRKPKQTVQD